MPLAEIIRDKIRCVEAELFRAKEEKQALIEKNGQLNAQLELFLSQEHQNTNSKIEIDKNLELDEARDKMQELEQQLAKSKEEKTESEKQVAKLTEQIQTLEQDYLNENDKNWSLIELSIQMRAEIDSLRQKIGDDALINPHYKVSEGENTEIDDATEVKKLDEFIEAAVIELALLQNLVSSTNNVDKHIYGAEILRLIRKITKELKNTECPVPENELLKIGLNISEVSEHPLYSQLIEQINQLQPHLNNEKLIEQNADLQAEVDLLRVGKLTDLKNKGIEMGSEQLQTGTIQATDDDASEHMRMIQQKLTQSEKQLADMQEKNAIKFVGWGRRVAELAASEKELNAKIKTFEQQLADENKEKWELVEKIDGLNADIKALIELNGCTNAEKTADCIRSLKRQLVRETKENSLLRGKFDLLVDEHLVLRKKLADNEQSPTPTNNCVHEETSQTHSTSRSSCVNENDERVVANNSPVLKKLLLPSGTYYIRCSNPRAYLAKNYKAKSNAFICGDLVPTQRGIVRVNAHEQNGTNSFQSNVWLSEYFQKQHKNQHILGWSRLEDETEKTEKGRRIERLEEVEIEEGMSIRAQFELFTFAPTGKHGNRNNRLGSVRCIIRSVATGKFVRVSLRKWFVALADQTDASQATEFTFEPSIALLDSLKRNLSPGAYHICCGPGLYLADDEARRIISSSHRRTVFTLRWNDSHGTISLHSHKNYLRIDNRNRPMLDGKLPEDQFDINFELLLYPADCGAEIYPRKGLLGPLAIGPRAHFDYPGPEAHPKFYFEQAN